MDEATLSNIDGLTRRVLEGIGATITNLSTQWQEEQERIYVNVDAGEDNGFLIGKEGRMLEAIKEIVEAAASRKAGQRVDIYLDIGGYWSKIEARALDNAREAAQETLKSGRPVRLEPMHPMLRRFLHKAFQADPQVETVSEGDGTWKRLVIRNKSAAMGNR